MKTRIDADEIKQNIDYQSITQEIITLSQNGRLQRQNPVAELLNPVKDALLAARQNNASISALVKFFKQKGIPLSEASLRRYLREQSGGGKARRTPRNVRKQAVS